MTRRVIGHRTHRSLVWMGGKILDRASIRTPKQLVYRFDCTYGLVVPVVSGMIIRIVDRQCFRIVTPSLCFLGIGVLGMKMMCESDSADRAERRSEVHVVARREESTP